MIEDDIYRASSQFRYWSYTATALESLRRESNELASERVRAALGRIRHANRLQDERNGKNGKSDGAFAGGNLEREKDVETLTPEEELKVVNWGCTRIIEIGKVMEPPLPMTIMATAIQFLRRFYLTNSPMTYHPRQIFTCALFLATKTDHWHIPLSGFVAKIPGTDEKDVRAPEFLLMQGLRFHLDVRHPMKALEGGVGEIQALIQEKSLQLDDVDPEKRLGISADKANRLLRGAAQMTDVYFLYTPSQIWLAALQAVDAGLVQAYLALKMDQLGPRAELIRTKLEATLDACSQTLRGHRSEDDANEAEKKEMKKEMKRIGRKLHFCQNPEKLDIVAVAKQKAAEKRDGSESDRERTQKKRKTERQRLEQDGDVFGASLSVPA